MQGSPLDLGECLYRIVGLSVGFLVFGLSCCVRLRIHFELVRPLFRARKRPDWILLLTPLPGLCQGTLIFAWVCSILPAFQTSYICWTSCLWVGGMLRKHRRQNISSVPFRVTSVPFLAKLGDISEVLWVLQHR